MYEYEKRKEIIFDSWIDLYNLGLERNIDWNTIFYEKSKYGIKEKKGIKNTNVHIIFNYSGKKYKLILNDCVLINKKWYMLDSMNWVAWDRKI